MTSLGAIRQLSVSDAAAPLAAYGAYCLLLAAALHPTFWEMARTWISSSSYSHGALVIPAAIWMMMVRRRAVYVAPSMMAIGGVAAGALLWLLGRAAGVALVEQIAFVSLLIAGAGAIFGLAAIRTHAYPLAFLFFMVPFGESLFPVLQSLTANASVMLLNLVGEVTFLDGVMIETRSGLFEVAEACAGLRFLLAALMISAVYAYVSLPAMQTRLTFLTVAVIIGLGANIIRAFLLIYIATISDMRLAVGADHYLIGLVFYGLVFLLLFYIGEKFAKRKQAEQDQWAEAPAKKWAPLTAFLSAGVILAASVYAGVVITSAPSTIPLRTAQISAPGWRILPLPDVWAAQTPNADVASGATYQHENRTVFFSYGAFSHDRPGAEIITYENRAYDSDDWRKIAEIKEVLYLFGASEERPFEILAGPERRRLAVSSAYWWNGEIYYDALALKRDQMVARLRGDNPPGGVFFIAAPFEKDPQDAINDIRAFTVSLEGAEKWISRMESP